MYQPVTKKDLATAMREVSLAKELVNSLQLKQVEAQRQVTASITLPEEAKKRVQEVLDLHVVGTATAEELAVARQAVYDADRQIEESQELLAAIDRQLLNCVRKYQKTAQHYQTLKHSYYVTILNDLMTEARYLLGDQPLRIMAAAELAGKFNTSAPELSSSKVLWDTFFPQGIRTNTLEPYRNKFEEDYAATEVPLESNDEKKEVENATRYRTK